MATIPYLQGVLRGLIKSRKEVVSKLDFRPHFVPLNIKALAISLGYLEEPKLKEFFDKIDSYSRKYKTLIVTSLKTYKINGVVSNLEDIKNSLPLRVANTSDETIGILYSSYTATQKNLFTNFINKELVEYVNNATYKDSNRSKGFDVGHTYIKSESKLADLADTPLSLQIGVLVNLVNILSEKGAGDEFSKALKKQGIVKSSTFRLGSKQKENLAKVTAELNSYFSNFISTHSYGQKVSIFLSKDVKGLLLDINANIVLIQDREENQGEFANVERKLREEVLKILPTLHFSKSAMEELENRYVELIVKGKVTSSNVSKKVKLEEDNRTNKVKAKPKVTGSKISSGFNTHNLRSLKGSFLSVVALENLIRASLLQKLKENMASPALNYRTGRLATSVNLNKITYDNRTNAITAFLSYMKYPYATFEPGGRMGSIERSPSLLIDRSIRDLAKELTSARLKTVIV